MITLFFDCEIKNLITPLPGYQACQGWRDFAGMGVAVVGCYHSRFGLTAFLEDQLDIFQNWVNSADRIVGFNSKVFDDPLLRSHGVEIQTNYDLLYEIRLATCQPANYTPGKTKAGYSLNALASVNLNKQKTGSGALTPQLWQDGKTEEVISYCLNDVQLLRSLYAQRKELIDPTCYQKICCRD